MEGAVEGVARAVAGAGKAGVSAAERGAVGVARTAEKGAATAGKVIESVPGKDALGNLQERVTTLGEATKIGEAAKATQRIQAEIPQKLRGDPKFLEFKTQLTRTNGEVGNKEVVDLFYQARASEEIGKGLPKETLDDPLFKKQVGEVRVESKKNGRNLTNGDVEKEALARYLKQKDQEEEAKAQPSPEADKRVVVLEKQVEELNNRLQELSKITQDLLAYLQEKETDKKSKSKLALLLAVAIAISTGQSIAGEAGKVATLRQN